MSSPKGETFREECEPTLPQGSPKGDMSGSEGGNAPRHGGVFRKRRRRSGALHENDEVLGALDDSDFC
jgi:hypothetical protein